MAASRNIPRRLIVVFLLCIQAVAIPQVNFSLSAQYPPVARVGEPFTFQFASTTFQPSPEKLQYSLIRNPSWLSLNSHNRTLWGTPGAGDVGAATFTITAAAEAGAVANMESTILVVNSETPSTNVNLSHQLALAGPISGPQTLTLSPSKSFDFRFPPDTFNSSENRLYYAATLADHTPLPSWIGFDAPSLHFSGTTPPLTSSSPQAFEMLLIASDTPGYAAASLSFTIAISDHRFVFKPLEQTCSFPKGAPVMVNSLRGALFLDDHSVTDEDVRAARAELPSWLHFDTQTFALTGSPPPGQMSQDVMVTVGDRFGDSAQALVHLVFKSDLFNGEIGQLNISAGEPFKIRLPQSVVSHENDSVSVDFKSFGQWLHFDSSTMTVSGDIPEDVVPQDVEATMIVTSSNSPSSQDTQNFRVHLGASKVLPEDTGRPSSSAPAPTSTADIASGASVSHEHAQHSSSTRKAVIAGTVVPLTIMLFLALVAGVLFYRRKGTEKRPTSPRKSDISRPIMVSNEWDRPQDPDLEKGVGDDTLTERTPEEPPQLNIDLPLEGVDPKAHSHSPTSSIGKKEEAILTAFDRSSWGFPDTASHSHHPPDSMKLPTEMARRSSAGVSSPVKHRRRTTEVYRDSYKSSGLPINRRLTGVGHGRYAHSPSPSHNNLAVARRRDCVSMSSHSTRSTSILSATPSAFPQPPSARHTTQLTIPFDKHRSIRIVPSTSGSIIDRPDRPDRRTLDERRRSYIKKRASTQSPFFQSSRASSSSYKPPPHITEAAAMAVPRMKAEAQESVLDQIERELTESLEHLGELSTGDSPTAQKQFPGSLRKPVSQRSFALKHRTAPAAASRTGSDSERPDTVIYTGPAIQDTARKLYRKHRTMESLATSRDSRVFEDALVSESCYSTDEEDRDELEDVKRGTLKPHQFSRPIHMLNPLRKNKRDSKRASKRNPTPYSLLKEHSGKENRFSAYRNTLYLSKEKAKGKATETSESKEECTSRHSRSRSHVNGRSRTRARPASQDRPLSRTHSSKSRRSRKSRSEQHNVSQSHSRSRHHSRSQSSVSANQVKHTRDRSRTQSSAYPYFEAPVLPLKIKDPRLSEIEAIIESQGDAQTDVAVTPCHNEAMPQSPSKPAPAHIYTSQTTHSLLPRDESGNILNYGLHENPQIEELAASNVGMRTSNGRISVEARKSKIAQLAEKRQLKEREKERERHKEKENALGKQKDREKRETAIPIPPKSAARTLVHGGYNTYSCGYGNGGAGTGGTLGLGLGLSLFSGNLGRAEETPAPAPALPKALTSTPAKSKSQSQSALRDPKTPRTPLSLLRDENGGTPTTGTSVGVGYGYGIDSPSPSPGRLRIVESKALRPVSVEEGGPGARRVLLDADGDVQMGGMEHEPESLRGNGIVGGSGSGYGYVGNAGYGYGNRRRRGWGSLKAVMRGESGLSKTQTQSSFGTLGTPDGQKAFL